MFELFPTYAAAMKVCDGDEENSMLSLTPSQDGAPPETVSDPLRVDWPKVIL